MKLRNGVIPSTYTADGILALKIITELQTKTKTHRFKSLPPSIGGRIFIFNKI